MIPLPTIGKPYVILAAVAAIAFACWRSYAFGVEVAEGRAAAAYQAQLAEQADAIRQHYESQAQAKVVTREKVRIIRDTSDPTGCADTAIPDAILDSLRQ